MSAIQTRGVSKSYGDVRALEGVSFDVQPGEVIGLLGPNGAGKSTLMKILTGYLQPDDGDAAVYGIDVVDDPVGVQRRIGYLPESAPLYGEMAVQEYLAMMAQLRGVPEADQPRRLSYAIRATGLQEYLTRPISQLSKGYKQRVGIAQAIVHRPDLLILDEPTTGLDPTQIAEIRKLIRELAKDTTILLSTHILPEVEMTCDRVLIIMRGQLRADSRMSELRESNAAVVAVESSAEGAQAALAEIAGVRGVESLGTAGDYTRFQLSGDEQTDLCPQIFDLVRERGWRIRELREHERTLESVFRELAEATA